MTHVCLGFSAAGMKRCAQCQRMPEGFQSPLLCSQTLPASVDPRCAECRSKLLRSEDAECLVPALDQRGRAGAYRYPAPCKDPEVVLILNNALCLLQLHTCINCLHYVLCGGRSSCFYSKAGLFLMEKVRITARKRADRETQAVNGIAQSLFWVHVLCVIIGLCFQVVQFVYFMVGIIQNLIL